MSSDNENTVSVSGTEPAKKTAKAKDAMQSKPKRVCLSVEDYVLGLNRVLGSGFATYVRTQASKGNKIMQRGTKAEWDATFQLWIKSPAKR